MNRNRVKQLTPEPQPLSLGSSFQRMPLLSKYRMPVSAARSDTGMRPEYRNRRGFAGSGSGSIIAYNSSSIIGLSTPSVLLLQRTRFSLRLALPNYSF
jgi:hypothetical protein